MSKKLTKDEILIMVAYINIHEMHGREVEEYMKRVREKLSSKKEDFQQWYFIPVRGQETKIECLNPSLLSENDYEETKQHFDRSQTIINSILETTKINNTNCKFCGESECYGGCIHTKKDEGQDQETK